MAFAAYGVVGSIDDAHWSALLEQLGEGRSGVSLDTGFAVSVATGTRVLSVSAGACVIAGVYVTSDAAATVTLDANTATSNSRIDRVCVQVDWAAAAAAYNATVGTEAAKGAAARAAGASLIALKGVTAADPVLPVLTKVPGTLWQMEVGRIVVRHGVGQLSASDLSDARPATPEKTCSGTVTLSDGGSDPKSVDVSFPIGFFTRAPRTALTPTTGATSSTVSNLNTSSQSLTGFTATLNRSTTTSVTVHWIASGN